MARIGIDGTAIDTEGKGVSRYLCEFLGALKNSPGSHDYVIFLNSRNDLPPLPAHPRFEYVRLPVFSSFVWEQLMAPRQIKIHHLDLFHTLFDRVPFLTDIPILLYLFEIPDYRMKLSNGKMPSIRKRIAEGLIRRFFPKSLKKASRIMVSSMSTGQDLQIHYRVPPEKIRLVYPGINSSFVPAHPKETSELRFRFSAPNGYILHFSSGDPRDNTPVALAAYRKALPQFRMKIPLVIAGLGKNKEAVFNECRKLGLENDVVLLGFKTGLELVRLYQAALVYFDPSLFEGFGFQIGEAMACGIPILASNVTSIPEVVGESAYILPPYDVEGFSKALVRILLDESLKKMMRDRETARVKKFNWDNTVTQTLEIYAEVLTEAGVE